MRILLILFSVGLMLSGCASPRMMATPEYQAREQLAGSLFRSDQAVLSDEAISKILNSKVVLPEKIKLAIMRYSRQDANKSRNYYGYYYRRDEEYIKLHQEYIDSVTQIILNNKRIVEATPLPDMITPKDATISILREAAVRLQADMLLVFDIQSDIYQKWTLFGGDQAKAYGTCEAILLDVRTGVIPFTAIITEDYITKKEKEDLNFDDTKKRAEKMAVLQALAKIGSELEEFLTKVP